MSFFDDLMGIGSSLNQQLWGQNFKIIYLDTNNSKKELLLVGQKIESADGVYQDSDFISTISVDFLLSDISHISDSLINSEIYDEVSNKKYIIKMTNSSSSSTIRVEAEKTTGFKSNI
jgi:3-hydroxyisobutyrate dehydrogenase-like beta-hydroxyacid dehydrogenase